MFVRETVGKGARERKETVLKVIDFGFSEFLPEDGSSTVRKRRFMGTLYYCAPEQYKILFDESGAYFKVWMAFQAFQAFLIFIIIEGNNFEFCPKLLA